MTDNRNGFFAAIECPYCHTINRFNDALVPDKTKVSCSHCNSKLGAWEDIGSNALRMAHSVATVR